LLGAKMKLISSKRRMAVIGLTVGLIAGASGLAFAFFTSTGSGNGSAQTGKASNVSISQVGAGYDSLLSNGAYTQDQCLAGCTGPNELGEGITLSTSDASQLTTVVVAIDNWGAAETNVPMTFWINNSVGGGPVTDTQDFSFPAAIAVNSDPSETNVTFDFTSQGAFVGPSLVYGITFAATNDAPDVAAADSLNVALSSSANDISVGSDTTAHTIYLDDSNGNNNDFPACQTGLPTTGFQQITTNCGPWNPDNPGAYGNEAVTDDIPAVEINVVGGTVTGLYPGGAAQPILYAITNSGTNNVQVGSVSVALNTSGSDVASPAPASADIPGCLSAWYTINNSPQTLGVAGGNIPPGTTLFTLTSPVASDLSIQMINEPFSQDQCEGADIGLNFTSN
jgi:hypothetical protein